MIKFASLFTGFGGAELGAKLAGLSCIWGIENDPAIADVAQQNGLTVICADVCKVDYTQLERPDWLHMSTPCTRASIANEDRGETVLDLYLARACIRAIRTLQPDYVSLENVALYEHFRSFKRIVAALRTAGYRVIWDRLNTADYGVPQTRKRLIMIASRVDFPVMPQRTHFEKPGRAAGMGQMSMLDTAWQAPARLGWYDAIRDLIPGLKTCAPAQWQLDRIKGTEFEHSLIVTPQNAGQEWGRGYRRADEPYFTVATKREYPRAFIVNGYGGGNNSRVTILDQDQPIFTVMGQSTGKQAIRAFAGRWVQCDPRCIARFQTFPDSYVLPPVRKLAALGIGNAIPPVFMQAIINAQGVNNVQSP